MGATGLIACIDLSGPLGQGRVLIESSGVEVRIQTQDGQNWTAPDADTLVEQLGVRLPVNGLRYRFAARRNPIPSPPCTLTPAAT